MSVKVSSWVWHEAGNDVMGNELVVLLALADVASDAGLCSFFDDPADRTQSGLARKARVSKSTLIRALDRLQDRSLLEVVRGRQHEPNGYRIVVPWIKSSGVILTTLDDSEVSSQPSRVVKSGTRSSLKRIDVNSDQFDAFWAVYPRKVGKASAQRAFVAAVKQVGPSTVINGARRFAEDPNLPEKQFIPHPTTWLHRGGWDDEALPVRMDSMAQFLPDASRVSVPWWVPVMKVPVEEFLERRSETGWVESMQALAAQRAS